MKQRFDKESLHIPNTTDLKRIIVQHSKERHQLNEMFSLLECMHSGWKKNCPKACWQVSFKAGKESAGGPIVVIEALCNLSNLWFWHGLFGYAESLNDLNILNLLPFLESLVDGTFSELEKNCGKDPNEVNNI
ncbi:Plant transposon protein [Fragilaria crotonensis]|nr:Plant transposon protein [Fragilaria crotonensis]